MQKEVRYGGLATNPSDYDAQDGQLAASLGLVHEDGAMRNVYQPKIKSESSAYNDAELLFLHTTDSYSHYIFMRESVSSYGYELCWANQENIDSGGSTITPFGNIGDEKATKICAIGNTLIVATPSYLYYFLWKNNYYLYLGDQLPRLDMSFGLNGVLRESQTTHFPHGMHTVIQRYSYPGNGETKTPAGWNYHEQTSETLDLNVVMSDVVAYIAERTKANEFVFPFMVRCAYRLYDGTLVRHTSPVLMLTCSDNIPKALVKRVYEGGYGNEIYYVISAIGNNLDYAFLGNLDNLNNWSDIIQSVDIFVSRPFYTIDINGEIKTLSNNVHIDGRYTGINTVLERYRYGYIWPCLTASTTKVEIDLPSRSIKKDIEDCSEFRLIHSIPIDKLQRSDTVSARHTITLENDVLSTLSTREVMNTDYEMYDRIIAGDMNVQNNRLTLMRIKRELAYPYRPIAFVPYTEENDSTNVEHCAYVVIEVDGEERVLKSTVTYNNTSAPDTPWIYLYYPNPNAKKIILKNYVLNSYRYVAYPLRVHDNLNGAFFFREDNPVVVDEPTLSGNPPVEMLNRLYVSEEGNPFVFALTSRHSLPVDEVKATAMATKALSQGQFGQFPLYAFTTEGVWALEVEPDGTYSSMHPVSRDVCINEKSITQLDNAVLFVTDRGIMMLQGSDTVCITDGILGEGAFDITKLPHITDSKIWPTKMADNISSPSLQNTTMSHAFLAGCRMVYDYEHQHIIVFNPKIDGRKYKYPYAFVYSLKSKMWGMMENTLAETVNSYPDAMCINKDGQLVTFGEIDETTPVQGLLVTRPLKLDGPDIYKTIHSMVQRGMFRQEKDYNKNHVKTLLYASRDLYKWYLIATSVDHWIRGLRGTPFKYFRIALLTNLAKDESVSGATVAFEVKEKDKLH